MVESRRSFLAAASAGAVAVALDRIRRARSRVTEAVARDAGADDYSLADGTVYLNHASIGTIPRVVQKAHRDYLDLCETNPWLYMWGGAWDDATAAAHSAAASYLGCDVGKIAVLRSTTEAFNLLAQGLPLRNGDEVVFSSLNHVGASACWTAQAPRRGFTVRKFDFPVAELRDLDEDALVRVHADQVNERTKVLVLPHIDNVVGVRLPIKRIAAAARKKGVRWIAADGAQAVAMIPVDVNDLGVDFYATSAHKWLQCPKGTGLLYVRDGGGGPLEPMFTTWGQIRWPGIARRYADYGTRDLPAMLSIADAIAFQRRSDDRRYERLRALNAHLHSAVDAASHLDWRSPNTFDLGASLVAVGLAKSVDPNRVAERLFKRHGIVVRPFSGGGFRHLRVAPNLANSTRDLDRLVAAIAT